MRVFLLPVALLASLPACGEPSCFVGATLVATPRGMRRLDELVEGDAIYSATDEGELVERVVVAIRRAMATTICRVSVGDVVVRGVTPTHPFFDARREEYVALRDLKPDAELRVFEGGEVAGAGLVEVSVREAPSPVFEVFDVTVSGPEHNFVADGVLVHNKSPPEEEPEPRCGDGRIDEDMGEECDDGNGVDADGCDAYCRIGPIVGAGGTYFDGFEGPCSEKWTLDGEWQCGAPTSGPGAAFSGDHVLATNLDGDYSDGVSWSFADAELVPISLADTTSPILQFMVWYELEDSPFDGFNVQVSTNGGASFAPLIAVTPSYDANVNNQDAWTGNNGPQWLEYAADLSAFAGDVVRIRFALRSDGSGTSSGVYIDDVTITDVP